jgi:hypothetical protein
MQRQCEQQTSSHTATARRSQRQHLAEENFVSEELFDRVESVKKKMVVIGMGPKNIGR